MAFSDLGWGVGETQPTHVCRPLRLCTLKSWFAKYAQTFPKLHEQSQFLNIFSVKKNCLFTNRPGLALHCCQVLMQSQLCQPVCLKKPSSQSVMQNRCFSKCHEQLGVIQMSV